MFKSREAVLREAERCERIASNYRNNLPQLYDPMYTSGMSKKDREAYRKRCKRNVEKNSAEAAQLRRLAAAWPREQTGTLPVIRVTRESKREIHASNSRPERVQDQGRAIRLS